MMRSLSIEGPRREAPIADEEDRGLIVVGAHEERPLRVDFPVHDRLESGAQRRTQRPEHGVFIEESPCARVSVGC